MNVWEIADEIAANTIAIVALKEGGYAITLHTDRFVIPVGTLPQAEIVAADLKRIIAHAVIQGVMKYKGVG